MRLALRGDSVLERIAVGLRLVPQPAVEAWGGLALSGVLTAAVRLGIPAALVEGPATATQLAGRLGLDTVVGQMMLDCLASTGYVRFRRGRYRLTRRARKWLDPASPTSVSAFVAATADYGAWWARLPEVALTGATNRTHDAPVDDDYWRRYITGQRDLARLSADEVAGRLPAASRVLDIGGGHGWYSVALCRRYPHLTATIIDLPGSGRIGREIVAQAGLADRIAFIDGDAARAELGHGYDLIMVFNLVHHLSAEEIVELFGRAGRALVPGGRLAVLDGFAEPAGRPNPTTAFLDLFMYLSSGGHLYTPTQLRNWLSAAGFGAPQEVAVRRLPGLRLYVAGLRQAQITDH